jgi:hypothetical protein
MGVKVRNLIFEAIIGIGLYYVIYQQGHMRGVHDGMREAVRIIESVGKAVKKDSTDDDDGVDDAVQI